MNRPRAVLTALASALVLGACAVNLGGPSDIPVPTVALRVGPDVDAATVARALEDAGARAAFVAAPRPSAWFQQVAAGAELELSGPATMADLELAFLGPEPLGDTTLTLPYDDGSLVIHDALYEIEEDRYLDLLAFRLERPEETRQAVGALLEYVATDVDNAAALVMAVLVPSAAVGDSVARMLSPAYYDAVRCGAAAAPTPNGAGVRLFYGPEARMYCADAAAQDAALGPWVRADLVMGRR